MLRRRSLQTLALLATLTAIPAPARAQTPDFHGMDAYVAKAVADWKVPGLAIAIVRGDSVVYARGFGVRALGRPERVDEHTLFAIGSDTKAFTATALAMLVDEGKVAWDDPVTKYVPTLRLADPYVQHELTVRDLLTHRSGLPNTDAAWYATGLSADEVIRRLRFAKPATSFRAGYEYQNAMFALAGRVVASASGMPWDEFVRRSILAPLGMRETVIGVRGLASAADVAMPHAEVDDTLRAIAYRDLDAVAPAGAINSSVADMARWIRFQLDSARVGQERLVKAGTFGETWTPQFTIPAARYYPAAALAHAHFTGYGLGWFLQDYRGRLLAMHTGSIDGMSAIVGLLPEAHAGVVVLANSDHAELRHALMYRALDLAAGDSTRDWSAEVMRLYAPGIERAKAAERARMAARVRGTHPSRPLAAYAATYADPDSVLDAMTVSVDAGRLVLRGGGAWVADLEHWSYDTWRARWRDRVLGNAFVTFTLDSAGKPAAIEVEGLARFVRRPDAPATPTP
ncbi:MAG: beta-lactamase [Gemmatimonadetes bacterium]|nr:beta-lactamase [Gemmatimonadota bacterium]